MFDKFEARVKLGNFKSAYAMLGWQHSHHHERYKRFVEGMPKRLLCQECGGGGDYVDDNIDGYDIRASCGWCEGTGLLTPWLRGQWLRYRRESKAA